MSHIHSVNPGNRSFTSGRWILWIGQCSPNYFYVHANSLEDALEETVAYVADDPTLVGLLCTEEVHEAYKDAIASGMSEEAAQEEAETDVTICDGGEYVRSDDWGYWVEDPSFGDIRELAERLRR